MKQQLGDKPTYIIYFALSGGNRHCEIYRGKSANHAKAAFHAAVPLLRASETVGRLSWSEDSTMTAYVQFDRGLIVDAAGAGYHMDKHYYLPDANGCQCRRPKDHPIHLKES